MKLIRKIDTKVVLYMFDNSTEISLTTELIAGDVRALDINSDTHEIVTGVAAPSAFVGGALTFDGEWIVINQAAIDAWIQANTPKVHVPQSVTRRQALQQLIIEGLDDDVEAVLAAIPNTTTRKLMTVWYRDSQIFERNRPEILQVWQALGRTSAQLDSTFIAASKL